MREETEKTIRDISYYITLCSAFVTGLSIGALPHLYKEHDKTVAPRGIIYWREMPKQETPRETIERYERRYSA